MQSPNNPQSFNRYTYVFNNPLKNTDPLGLFSPEELAAADIYRSDEGMTDALWTILVEAQYGQDITWTSPEGTSERTYRFVSGDQERATCDHFLSRGPSTATINGEMVRQFNPNREGIYLQEMGKGKLLNAGEMDSSNLRGDFTFEYYSGYTDTMETIGFHNPYYSWGEDPQHIIGLVQTIAGVAIAGIMTVALISVGIAAPAFAPEAFLVYSASYGWIDSGVQMMTGQDYLPDIFVPGP